MQALKAPDAYPESSSVESCLTLPGGNGFENSAEIRKRKHCISYTVRPNKKETRFISEISLLPRKI